MAISEDNELAVGGERPSVDEWIRMAKSSLSADGNGMYLVHNGVVRGTSRSDLSSAVCGMDIAVDRVLLDAVVAAAAAEVGINCVRVWINEGHLSVGEDIMLVLVAGDTRTHVVDTLVRLVKRIKGDCITESEF